jgi:hypothetical protein
MLNQRREQAATGRPMPQVNEEYGYEDHYPQGWGGARVAPARSSDNRRRLAWEMVMAGGYQTTGEYTANGLGGWINGRGGDDTMLTGNARLMDFITSFEWWKTEPRPDLCAAGALCLAEPGRLYVLYSRQGADVSANMDAGTYQAQWYNPRSGVWSEPQEIQHPGGWLTLVSPDRAGDMAVKLTLRP